jgi:hypothetical protein
VEDLVLIGAPAGPAGLVLLAVAVGDDDELGGVDELVAAARVAAEARQREIGEVALGAGAGDLDAVAVLAADADDLQVGVRQLLPAARSPQPAQLIADAPVLTGVAVLLARRPLDRLPVLGARLVAALPVVLRPAQRPAGGLITGRAERRLVRHREITVPRS